MTKHRPYEAGGNPAAGPHPDVGNPIPDPHTGNEFPDDPTPSNRRRGDQDKPDLDRFAHAIGTDRLAERDADEQRVDWRSPLSSALGGLASGAKFVAGKLADASGRVMPSSHDDETANEATDVADLQRRLKGVRTAMVTTIDERGTLSSRPLTVQELTADGDAVFVVARDADWVTADPGAVNVALVDDGRTWVSIAGRAVVRDDRAELDRRWSPLLDTFFPGGRADAVVLHVVSDRWEYWRAPNRVAQVAEMLTSVVGDSTPDLGDSGTVET